MVYVTQIEKLKLFDRQASDDKRALRGRQPTSFIAFIWFVLCYFNLFCRYTIQILCEKMEKKLEPVDQKVGTTHAYGGTAVPVEAPKKQQIGMMEARPVPVEARPCLTFWS